MKQLVEKISFLPVYSDTRILFYALHWKAYAEFWRYLTLSNHNAYTLIKICLVDAFHWYSELFSTSIRVVSRRQFGRSTFGCILAFSTIAMMTVFNWDISIESLIVMFKEVAKAILAMFTDDVVHWRTTLQKLYQPKSYYLLGHSVLFGILSIYHILAIYFVEKWRNTENPMSKGTSHFYSLFKPYCALSERYYSVYFEGCLFLLLGVFFMVIIEDIRYGLFLIISSSCLFMGEFINHCVRNLHKD